MQWINLTDVRCGYEVLGRGAPLLLVPGLGATCEVWDPAVSELAAHFSLILVDNRGIGRSQPLRSPETLRDYAADLVELMDYLQLDRAHVMGLSLGGMIARRVAADHRSRVDRLVLMSCTDRFTPYLRQVMHMLAGILRGFPMEAFVRAIETLGTSPEFYDAHEALAEQEVRRKCMTAAPGAIARQLACLAGEPDEHIEPDPVHVPTLVIAGEHDLLIPACYARAMAERIDGSRFVSVVGAGHNPLLERPDEVVPVIVEFLSQSKPMADFVEVRGAEQRKTQFSEEGAVAYAANK